jgi:nucleoside-diphosphate-sugar epimerase
MPNILITGANSFIGSHYTKITKNNVLAEFCLINNNASAINFHDVDVVLHLAAIVHQKNVPDSFYKEVNTDLAVEVAQLAKAAGVKLFIFMSTLSVYGDNSSENHYLNEFSECNPNNAYGKSKLDAEKEIIKLGNENFAVAIIRPPLVYGENVKANMFDLIKLVDKFPVLPFANTNNSRSFVAIENLVTIIDSIIEKQANGIFIACDEEPVSTSELVKLIAKGLEKKLILFKLPRFLLKIGMNFKPQVFEKIFGSFVVNNSFTVEKLNFRHQISPHEAIVKMARHYKKSKS